MGLKSAAGYDGACTVDETSHGTFGVKEQYRVTKKFLITMFYCTLFSKKKTIFVGYVHNSGKSNGDIF